MNSEDPVRDIMQRTIFNLEFIEKNKNVYGPYETTQLLNSFLGALAHPWERYRKELNKISLDEAYSEGWPRVEKQRTSDKDPKSLGDLIRLMRNGLAHGNITFYPDSNNVIHSILIWNKKNGYRDWGAILSVDVLKQFLLLFVELAINMHHTDNSNRYDDS